VGEAHGLSADRFQGLQGPVVNGGRRPGEGNLNNVRPPSISLVKPPPSGRQGCSLQQPHRLSPPKCARHPAPIPKPPGESRVATRLFLLRLCCSDALISRHPCRPKVDTQHVYHGSTKPASSYSPRTQGINNCTPWSLAQVAHRKDSSDFLRMFWQSVCRGLKPKGPKPPSPSFPQTTEDEQIAQPSCLANSATIAPYLTSHRPSPIKSTSSIVHFF
jgi:hypothetical protein